MNGFRRMMQVLLLAVVVSFGLTGCATSCKTHPDFINRQKNISSVAMVTPDIYAYMRVLKNMKGEEQVMPELAASLEGMTREKVEAALVSKGYTVKKLDLSETAMNAKPELRTSLSDARKKFKEEIKSIAEARKGSFEYSIGLDATVLAKESGSDVLIFVKEEAYKVDTKLMMTLAAMDTAVNVLSLVVGGRAQHTPTCGTLVQMAVVDPKDGAILWYNDNALKSEYDPTSETQVDKVMNTIIKPFPDSAKKTAIDAEMKTKK